MSEEATNKELYETLVQPVVNAFLSGVNGTVMVYGPTGAGKTYTMIGDEQKREELRCYKVSEAQSSSESNGVLLYAVDSILKSAITEAESGSTNILKCSYIEVYNDSVFDLLQDKGQLQSPLAINESDSKEFVIKDATEYSIRKPQDFFEAIKKGESK